MFTFLRTYLIALFITCGISHAATIATLDGIVISEILADPNTSGNIGFDTDGNGSAQSGDEFVEFYNPTTSVVDISGWQVYVSDLSGNLELGHTFSTMAELGINETIVIVGSISSNAPTPLPDFIQDSNVGGFSLANGGDAIVLFNPAANQFIASVYNGATFNTNALPLGATQIGETVDFGNDTDSQSLSLSVTGTPIINGIPTPGTSDFVPEPTSSLLALTGILLAFRRHRA